MATFEETWAGWNVDQRLAFIQFTNRRPPTQAEINTVIREWAGQHFGALAAYLDVPEVGSIITQAAQAGWTPARLQTALAETTWWQTTTASQRQWDALNATDPATAKAQVTTMADNIRTLVAQEGIATQYSEARITELATLALRNGAQADDVPRLVLAEAQYAPTQAAGKLGARMTQVQQAAFEYGLPLDEASAFDIAKKVEIGTMTAEGATDLFKIQAKAAYGTDPNLVAQIDAGFTLRQILAPQIGTAAQLLGVGAETIDFRDPRWAQIVSYDDGTTRRVANASETAKIVRSTDEYWQTAGAEAEAAKFVQDLAKQLGRA